jgi:hypothetical protein
LLLNYFGGSRERRTLFLVKSITLEVTMTARQQALATLTDINKKIATAQPKEQTELLRQAAQALAVIQSSISQP